MYLTGFADEAASDIEGQIKATKELGWKYTPDLLESREKHGVEFYGVAGKE